MIHYSRLIKKNNHGAVINSDAPYPFRDVRGMLIFTWISRVRLISLSKQNLTDRASFKHHLILC